MSLQVLQAGVGLGAALKLHTKMDASFIFNQNIVFSVIYLKYTNNCVGTCKANRISAVCSHQVAFGVNSTTTDLLEWIQVKR